MKSEKEWVYQVEYLSDFMLLLMSEKLLSRRLSRAICPFSPPNESQLENSSSEKAGL